MPYTRHHHVMSSEFDEDFRAMVRMGLSDKTLGSLESPIGKLSMLTAESDSDRIVPVGLYIAQESEIGIIVVFSYNSEGDREADWANAEAELTAAYEDEYRATAREN